MNEIDWTRLADLADENIGPREEDVKVKIVLPLLKLLGFSDLDFSFETPSDLGRIDIAVKGFPVGVVTECKGPRVRLEDFMSQVERYVRDTMTNQHAAMVSLLTNGRQFQVYGVLGAIHKNTLTDHLLFEFRRVQLKEADTQSRLKELLGRDAVSGKVGDIRASIESTLRARREADQERNDLLDQLTKLQEQEREIKRKLGNHESVHSYESDVDSQRTRKEHRFKWAKYFGPQEVVCPWIGNCLEKLAPPGSIELISRDRVKVEFAHFLSTRGTEETKSWTQNQMLRTAGNIIDWVGARWTTALGPERVGSDRTGKEAGAKVESPGWLREFTTVWTRKLSGGKWAFKRR